MQDFETAIHPFSWAEYEGTASICLYVGEYKTALFQTRAEEGFDGNGYDWASLAAVFLAEQMPALQDKIELDPEADMFCVYAADKDAMRQFALGFKQACENEALITDLFSRAQLA